jgi:glycine/D-amino acid oxidase-like deaminating enzyme
VSKQTEVAVIGGGIIGAATADRLAAAGARVTLLDAGEPGRGTSSSSFAWLNSSRKEPRGYHDLNVSGIGTHLALAEQFDAAPWLLRDGGLHWATSAEGEAELRERAARLRGWGYAMEQISADEAREMEPGLLLDPEVVRAVWFTPVEGWCDVPLLVHHLLERAREHGARVRAGEAVVGVERRGDRVAGLRLAGGETLAADAVVVCAGPRTAEVTALFGARMPVARVPGLLTVTKPVAQPLRRVCLAETITLRADPSGGLVLADAGDLDATIDAETPLDPLPPACEVALARGGEFYPEVLRAGLAAARIGVRPIPADDVSIVGALPGLANAYVVATHSGVTLGPLLGRLIAEEVVTGRPAAQTGAFRPERFGVGA